MFRPNDELRARVLARVAECVQIVGLPGFEVPTVFYFGNKLTVGLARFHENSIGLNAQLLEHNTERVLHDTVAHEVAHLIVWHLEKCGLAPDGEHVKHGKYWKDVMRTYFKIEPERVSSYDLSCMTIRRQKRHRYGCACPGKVHKITTIKHNRMQRGKTNYRCIACKTRIVLKQEIEICESVAA